MTTTTDRHLFNVAARIFEDLGFFLPTPELEPGQAEAAPEATVHVSFEGPFAGQLIVTLCGNLLSPLAVNMLGADEELPIGQQYDSLGEIGNVICGNLLPQVAGAEHVFRLAAPQVLPGPAGIVQSEWVPLARASIGLEDGRADLLLIGEPGATAHFKE